MGSKIMRFNITGLLFFEEDFLRKGPELMTQPYYWHLGLIVTKSGRKFCHPPGVSSIHLLKIILKTKWQNPYPYNKVKFLAIALIYMGFISLRNPLDEKKTPSAD